MFKSLVFALVWATVIVTGLSTEGCSTVGPGLANHPLDCSIGIRWADCLPGTAGYNNGGGQKTRSIQLQTEENSLKNRLQAVRTQCEVDMRIPELDPIRDKIEFFRDFGDAPPPFSISTNDNFPTTLERLAIAKWATLRDACIRREIEVQVVPPSATPQQAAFLQQDWAFPREVEARVSDLIIALYQQKLTYAEFASKRYELGQQAATAERQFRRATSIADEQLQHQAEQLAQQQFQNNLLAWSTYTQQINARTPQTIRLHCTSQSIGNFVSTNCN